MESEPVIFRANAGGQWAFMSDVAHRYVALEGGWASGKTWAGARKLLYLHLLNNHRTGKVPSAVIGPTYRNLLDVDVPELVAACDQAGYTVKFLPSRMELWFKRPRIASIIFRTADRPEAITGWEVGAFWGDEAARWPSSPDNPMLDPLTQILGRLRHPAAEVLQGLFTYTNEGDGTKVYEFFQSGGQDRRLYRAGTRENPLMQDFLADMRRQLTPELARQYLDGEAISLRGQKVYPPFDPIKHVSDAVKLEPTMPLHLAIDFNINPGMHAEIGQYWPDRDMLVVAHELHAPNMTVRELAESLGIWVRTQGGFKWPELLVYGDATGRARWSGTGASNYQVLTQGLAQIGIKHTLRVPSVNPFVEDRVQAFNMALLDIAGNSHWICHPSCRRLIDDLTKMKRGRDGQVSKDDEKLSHASDAEGYRISVVRPLRRPAAGPSRIVIG